MEVYTRLVARGATVRVVSAAPGEETGRRLVNGIPTEFVAARDLSAILKAQVTWAPAVRAAAVRLFGEFRPHVAHATSIHFQSALLGSSVAHRCGIPVVTTGHVASISALPLPTRLATAAYEHTLSRRLLQRSARVIAVSDPVRAHLETLGADPARVSVISNGVDVDRFTPGEGAHGRRVVFVGRLIGNKGPIQALEAFAQAAVPGSELLMVGDGPLRPRLEDRVRRLGLGDAVHFLGFRSDVDRILATGAVFVRSSLTEGQSLAMLEAMAAGLCVVASDIPANRALLQSGRAGLLVPPGDTSALARAIRLALTDEPLRRTIAHRGRQAALGHSWDVCAELTGEVLESVAMLEPERAP
jgi:glycosyltransferase involved in cell wall biosynthesis